MSASKVVGPPDGRSIKSRELERETRFEPATFCLGSPELVSVVA